MLFYVVIVNSGYWDQFQQIQLTSYPMFIKQILLKSDIIHTINF